MSAAAETTAIALPAVGKWDFGDYHYGLEPLTLPPPDSPARASTTISAAGVTRAYLDQLAATKRGLPTVGPVADADLERLYWFRWIIGHHISFIIWRLLADALRRAGAGLVRRSTAIAITQYVRGYCGMLLYTSSCTPSIYNEVIRPSMYRLHRTFSGTWAPDYRPVRSLFRGRRTPPVPEPERQQLVREVKLSQSIHLGVARKLVANGQSLLQQSIADRSAGPHLMWGRVFDCCFLTLRARVSREEIAAQLLRRQQAVAIDLATNGLFPSTVGPVRLPAELTTPAVAECERDLVTDLLRVAGLAAGLDPDRVRMLLESECG